MLFEVEAKNVRKATNKQKKILKKLDFLFVLIKKLKRTTENG